MAGRGSVKYAPGVRDRNEGKDDPGTKQEGQAPPPESTLGGSPCRESYLLRRDVAGIPEVTFGSLEVLALPHF